MGQASSRGLNRGLGWGLGRIRSGISSLKVKPTKLTFAHVSYCESSRESAAIGCTQLTAIAAGWDDVLAC